MSTSRVTDKLRGWTKAMKVAEVAELLNLDPDTVVRYANDQKMPAFRVGARWRFDPETLAQWIENQSSMNHEEIGHD